MRLEIAIPPLAIDGEGYRWREVDVGEGDLALLYVGGISISA